VSLKAAFGDSIGGPRIRGGHTTALRRTGILWGHSGLANQFSRARRFQNPLFGEIEKLNNATSP